jgi:hypothetical protein
MRAPDWTADFHFVQWGKSHVGSAATAINEWFDSSSIKTASSIDLSRATERPLITTLSSNLRVVASRNSNKPVSEARSLVI